MRSDTAFRAAADIRDRRRRRRRPDIAPESVDAVAAPRPRRVAFDDERRCGKLGRNAAAGRLVADLLTQVGHFVFQSVDSLFESADLLAARLEALLPQCGPIRCRSQTDSPGCPR